MVMLLVTSRFMVGMVQKVLLTARVLRLVSEWVKYPCLKKFLKKNLEFLQLQVQQQDYLVNPVFQLASDFHITM